MINIFAFISPLVFFFTVQAQSRLSFEQYNYIHQPDAAAFVPMMHFETKNNWRTELRYNYEDAHTLSLFLGKTFSTGREVAYTITPMAGYSTGLFSGITLAVNSEAEWKNFYLSAESQYSLATIKTASDFFFNWSELGYTISDRFFTGLTMQYTRQMKQNNFEPGLLAGISFTDISFPFYVFNPFRNSRYFVLGLNYEYNLKKKTR